MKKNNIRKAAEDMVYESDYGYGFFGCESDDYATKDDAIDAAVLYLMSNATLEDEA